MSDNGLKLTAKQYQAVLAMGTKPAGETAPAVTPSAPSVTLNKSSILSVANALATACMVYEDAQAIASKADRKQTADFFDLERKKVKAVNDLLIRDVITTSVVIEKQEPKTCNTTSTIPLRQFGLRKPDMS
jgi:hypothetical protein